MDFESFAAGIPGSLDKVMTQAASYIPDDLSDIIWHARSYLPVEVDIVSAAKFMLYLSAISLILAVLGRVFLGKRSSLNLSVSSAMGILFIYAMTVVIYTFHPWNLDALLSPLPFANYSGEYLKYTRNQIYNSCKAFKEANTCSKCKSGYYHCSCYIK